VTLRSLALLLVLLCAALPLGCGGSSDEGQKSPTITDPASVPSSTPIQNANLYQIRGGEIIVQGFSTPAPVTDTQTPQSYTVVAGDTCSLIADKLNVDLQELMAANRTINAGCTNLRPGDILRLPAGSDGPTPTPPAGSGRTYVVSAGDTCSGIAQSYAVSVADLIVINGLDSDCLDLQVGAILTIP